MKEAEVSDFKRFIWPDEASDGSTQIGVTVIIGFREGLISLMTTEFRSNTILGHNLIHVSRLVSCVGACRIPAKLDQRGNLQLKRIVSSNH